MKKNIILLLVLLFLYGCNSKTTMEPNQQDHLKSPKSALGDEAEYVRKTAKEPLENIGKRNEIIEQYFQGIKYANSPIIAIEYCTKILMIDPANAAAFYKRGEGYRDAAELKAKTDTEKKEYIKKAKEDFEMAKKLGYKNEEETNEKNKNL